MEMETATVTVASGNVMMEVATCRTVTMQQGQGQRVPTTPCLDAELTYNVPSLVIKRVIYGDGCWGSTATTGREEIMYWERASPSFLSRPRRRCRRTSGECRRPIGLL